MAGPATAGKASEVEPATSTAMERERTAKATAARLSDRVVVDGRLSVV